MKPVQIEIGEWWYKGCFIQKQEHPELLPWLVFKDNFAQSHVGVTTSFASAKKLAERNEVTTPHLGYQTFLY
jgi:hypothetical protein